MKKTIPFLILIILPFFSYTQEYLRVYTSAPGMMTSNATGGTISTETFTSFSGVPNYNWAPQPNGYTSSIGTYIQTTGQSYVKNDDIYGAGTGKYMAIRNSGKVTLEFDTPQRYFGFAWPAGDGQNTIKIIRNGQVIGTFTTNDVVALLPKNTNNFIISINGTSYSTYNYYGKPGSGGNANEPYAYLHFYASAGLAFTGVEFSMGAGGEFENDNHSIIDGVPELQGDWVELISIFNPVAVDDNGAGMPGEAVTVDVLNNDTPGSSPILPSSVQIDGTLSAGASLVVPGEGTWSVNTTTGAITFTPVPALVGSPTPIQYFVKDQDGFGSNLATVTIIYPIGPTANNDNASTNMNVPVTLNIYDNDTKGTNNLVISTIAFVAGTEPDPSTIGVFTNNADGTVTFTPATGFTGTANIDYQICDEIALCDIATITIVVNAVDGPTANDDQATTLINTPVVIEVLDNDTPGSTAIDPTTVSFVAGTEPDPDSEGVFTIDPLSGNITFTPVNGFLGTVTIDYQVCDLNALCDIATITINVLVGASNLYPALGPGTLAFEDLWPGKGDYDFNDMVIDYQFEIISNTSNFVEQVTATFVLKAFGASLENGFGFQLSENILPSDLTVTGHGLTDNIITNESNGTEAGQSKPTIVVFDNAFEHMSHPGIGIGVNTTPEAPYVQPVTFIVNILFKADTYTYNDLDISNFNPFIIVNKNRSHEVHLPNYPPTDLVDMSLFGQWEDASDPGNGKYYVTSDNLPWAINIYESFDYPIEKQEIIWVHLKFAEWAISGGTLFPDWYKNLTGYRNASLIYQVPQN
ncbi:MAG: hypothetical protein CVT92_13850 [Bacteroidetes bacterium HGW-Bacteroidetes-1]|jgi:LruC domain-containing protein|nr:MAG: hypothetical protein CVT92_13850 [Bacteroidetes bacterium HGW-Bacteroidetes-1]